MVKLVKVYTSLNHRANKKIKVYISGKPIYVDFNNECTTEVSEDILVELLNNDSSLSVFDKEFEKSLKKETDGEKIIALNQKIVELTKENESLKEQLKALRGEEVDDDNGKIKKEDFEKMTVKELKVIAEESKLPVEEWDKLGKKDLVDYLFSKLSIAG